MEMAGTEDRTWTDGDRWQYITCLQGPSGAQDPFDMAEDSGRVQQVPLSKLTPNQTRHAGPGKGRKLLNDTAGGSAKRAKKLGACRLFNKPPGGCPYGKECIFVHFCSNCGALNDNI